MHWGVFIWILAVFSGLICHSKQCTLADYYLLFILFLERKERKWVGQLQAAVKYFTVAVEGKLLVENIPLFLWKLYSSAGGNDSPIPTILCVGKGKSMVIMFLRNCAMNFVLPVSRWWNIPIYWLSIRVPLHCIQSADRWALALFCVWDYCDDFIVRVYAPLPWGSQRPFLS